MAEVADVTWQPLPADAMSGRPLPARTRVDHDGEPFDLAFFVAMAPGWMRALRGVRGLRDAARATAVYLFDAWPHQTRGLRRWRRELGQFDHVFVSFREAVPVYESRVRGSVHHLLQATSAARFRPDREDRPVHLLSLGRRHERAHQRLVRLAAAEDLLYAFADRTEPYGNLEQSRVLGASLARASRAQLSWSLSATSPERAHGLEPVTTRWFDGAACASIVVGQRPRNPLFDELFPYEGFAVDVDPESPELEARVLEILERTDDRPARLELAGRILAEHTWHRRCEEILATALVQRTDKWFKVRG